MKALFMGRKPAASIALETLVDAGVNVVGVVAPGTEAFPAEAVYWRPLLRDTAAARDIPLIEEEEIYGALETGPEAARHPELFDVDLVLSFLYWRKIRPPLIELPRIGCFNFHPAPLPGFRRARGYNYAILEGHEAYGASVHWVSAEFDEGDLVEVRTFPVRTDETALSLEQRTMGALLEMFDDFVQARLRGEPVPRNPQGEGQSATRAEMLALRAVRPDDSAETIACKVRAFWYPPFPGASIQLAGREYTLVDNETLAKIGRYIHGSRDFPY